MELLKNESSGLGTACQRQASSCEERENIACYMENERARERDSRLVSLDQHVNMSIASTEPLKCETSVTIGPVQ